MPVIGFHSSGSQERLCRSLLPHAFRAAGLSSAARELVADRQIHDSHAISSKPRACAGVCDCLAPL